MLTFEDYIWPLKNLEQVFSLIYISSKCDPSIEIRLIGQTFNTLFESSLSDCDIENLLNKLTNFNHESFMNKINIIDEKLKNKSTYCGSTYKHCKFCQGTLKIKKGTECVIFCCNDMQLGISLIKTCEICNIKYFIDKYEMNGTLFSDRMAKLITTSSESVFEVYL